MLQATLKIEYVPPHALRPLPSNAKRHPKSQIAKIAKSIRRFGFVNPVLVSDKDEIIAGFARVEAAKEAGLDSIPVVRLSSLTRAERLALNLTDNRLAELGRLDGELVAVQMEELTDLGFDDIEITGFSLDRIDIHLHAKTTEKQGGAQEGGRHLSRQNNAFYGSELWAFKANRMLVGDTEAIAQCRRLIDCRRYLGTLGGRFLRPGAGPERPLLRSSTAPARVSQVRSR